MANILSFKKLELTAASFDEAKEKAPFGIQGNATQSFNNWKKKQTDGITDAKIREFCLEYLEKKTKNVPGSGFIIVLDSAVADKRENPYKKVNVKNTDGKREWDTVLRIEGKTTGKVYATVTPEDAKKFAKTVEKNEDGTEKEIRVKKSDADKIVKDLYRSGTLTEGVNVFYAKVPRKKSQALAASYDYTPSKGTKAGTYLVFGIEA